MTENENPSPAPDASGPGDSLGIPGVSGLVEIGRGGFGIVYRGIESSFQRDVAVKVLPAAVDETTRSRFDRERLATGTLSGHPNIVTVFRGGFTAGDQPFLVMEFLPGGSLGDRLKTSGALPWTEVADIGVKLAGALETAHRAGVLHRDIKPGNVFQSGLGEPKLGDFGIARLQGGTETRSSAVTASIVHAPPEVISGQRPDHRSDIYALGSSLYELLSGRAAFAVDGEESLVPMLARIATADAEAPALDPAARPVIDVVLRSMQKQPEGRYESAAEFGEALRSAQAASGLAQTPLLIEGQAAPGGSMPGAEFGSASTMPSSQNTAQISAPTTGDAPMDLPPPPPPVGATTALTPIESPAPAPPPVIAPPVTAPPPATAGSGPVTGANPIAVEPASPNRTGILVAIGAFVLLLAGLGGWALTQARGDTVAQGSNGGPTVGSTLVPQPSTVPDSFPPISITPSTTTAPVVDPPVTTQAAPTTQAPPPTTSAPVIEADGEPLPVDFTDKGVRYSEYSHDDGVITLTVPTKWTEVRQDAAGQAEYAAFEGFQPYVGVSIGLTHGQLGSDRASRDLNTSGMRVFVTRGAQGQSIDLMIDDELAKFADCGEPGDRLPFIIPGAGIGKSQFYTGCEDVITSFLVTVVVHEDDPSVYTTVVTQLTIADIGEFNRQLDIVVDASKVPAS